MKDAVSAAGGRAAAPTPGVDLVLAWHMHQPDYRDHATGEFTMPWVYLHAIKDYSDMAWHLEQNPLARAVVNFVPILLEQLEDYCDQFERGTLRDPLLRLLGRSDAAPLAATERALVLDRCFRANHTRLIEPYPPYQRLHELFQFANARGTADLEYFADRYFYDLLVWYHLSWTGESVRREDPLVGRLMEQGTGFGQAERSDLLALIGREIHAVVPRYRALAHRGQVELTTTPQCHPLSPLLLDLTCAHQTLPDAPLPGHAAYPGGRESVLAHLDEGLAGHAQRFGVPARGLWPAEGALSEPFAAIIASRGIAWTASSEAVLHNSLRRAGVVGGNSKEEVLYRPWRLPAFAGKMLFLFRDDRLSDLIGFEYSRWNGSDAATNFTQELGRIAEAAGTGPRPLVTVILDGENAWEYYPYNAFWFFTDFYRHLTESPHVRMLTGADVVDLHGAEGSAEAPGDSSAGAKLVPRTLAKTAGKDAKADAKADAHSQAHALAAPGELTALAAGSWVYGNLSTWIGSPDKNRAWDLLCDAREAYDRVMATPATDDARRAQATRQLRDCEASDWFWWPGEHNPGASVSAFESLFRAKLAHLYRLLGLEPPPSLSEVFSTGGGDAESGGTMRRVTG